MFRVLIAILAALALACLALPAWGQQQEPSQIYQRVTIYDVADGDTIDADLEVPRMDVIAQRREARQASLIRLREDYVQRVLTSVKKL